MITTSGQLASALRAGGFRVDFICDVIVDGQRELVDQALSDVQLTWNGDNKVRCTGRATLQYADDEGRSVLPELVTSWFTPYATVLNVSMLVTAAAFSERVFLGPMKLTGVTDPTDFRRPFADRYISTGSSVGLPFADLSHVTDLERFPAPSGPTDLSSVWAEIGRLTLLPLNRTVADAPITKSVTYQDNRLDAVVALAAILGGYPFVDENGHLAIEADEWPEVGYVFPEDAEGVLISRLPADLSDDGIYNQVVVRSSDDQSVILATAEVTDGPLRYGGTFGRVPYFASSQYVTTADQAQAYAYSQLPKVSSLPAVQFALAILPDPRLQVGDVVQFLWEGFAYTARIREVSLQSSGPMVLRVVVGSKSQVVASELFGYGVGDFSDGTYEE